MKLSTLFVVHAVIAAIFGLGMLLVPGPMMSVYGITLDAVSVWFARLLGAATLGLAVLSWFARNAADSEARRAILLAEVVYTTLGFIVISLAMLSGFANTLGWSQAAIYLLFALGFGYFQFIKPAA